MTNSPFAPWVRETLLSTSSEDPSLNYRRCISKATTLRTGLRPRWMFSFFAGPCCGSPMPSSPVCASPWEAELPVVFARGTDAGDSLLGRWLQLELSFNLRALRNPVLGLELQALARAFLCHSERSEETRIFLGARHLDLAEGTRSRAAPNSICSYAQLSCQGEADAESSMRRVRVQIPNSAHVMR